MSSLDKKFMSQALKLAALGGRAVAPNPMVGAVIVKNGKVIGKGYHKKFGGPHAEVNAINSVKNKKNLIGATIYVTLEPCRHYGKTPPCMDLINSVGISKVICIQKDPFQKTPTPPNVRFLKSDESEKLNKFYFTRIRKNRPFITVKIAISADGFVAGKNGKRVHITSKKQDIEVHKLRAAHQAILVGSNTVLNDDPQLNVRLVKGSDPLRIILDSKKRVPKTAKVFRDRNFMHITKKISLKKLFHQLSEMRISSVLVEPGPTLYKVLKKLKLIDELIVFKGRKKIRNGIRINNLYSLP
jgi:diaminohydroxyphosphoribosylaminopyrimidine deaminase/5-amino-6-(5-phosphoribosylamino)uracil reductase